MPQTTKGRDCLLCTPKIPCHYALRGKHPHPALTTPAPSAPLSPALSTPLSTSFAPEMEESWAQGGPVGECYLAESRAEAERSAERSAQAALLSEIVEREPEVVPFLTRSPEWLRTQAEKEAESSERSAAVHATFLSLIPSLPSPLALSRALETQLPAIRKEKGHANRVVEIHVYNHTRLALSAIPEELLSHWKVTLGHDWSHLAYSYRHALESYLNNTRLLADPSITPGLRASTIAHLASSEESFSASSNWDLPLRSHQWDGLGSIFVPPSSLSPSEAETYVRLRKDGLSFAEALELVTLL